MKKNYLSWLLFAGLMATGTPGFAQNASVAAGGEASGSGGSLSYSVGQVAYTADSSPMGSVSRGVQQAYVISSVGVDEPGISLAVSAYPNPVADFLTLAVESDNFQSLSYQLFDMNGKLLSGERISGTQTRISMLTLTPATYQLRVIRGKKLVKTFSIIKTF